MHTLNEYEFVNNEIYKDDYGPFLIAKKKTDQLNYLIKIISNLKVKLIINQQTYIIYCCIIYLYIKLNQNETNELFQSFDISYNKPENNSNQINLLQIFESDYPTKKNKAICIVYDLPKNVNVKNIEKISKNVQIESEKIQTVLDAVNWANQVIKKIHLNTTDHEELKKIVVSYI